MNIHFRNATAHDLIHIIAMLADDPLGAQREAFQEPLPDAYTKAFSIIDRDPHQDLIIMEIDGVVAGTMQLSFIQYLTYQGGIRLQIEAVRVHQDFRGQGLGKQMFQWAIEQGKQRGAHVVQLTTDKKRPDAIRFYHELGFKDSHEGMKLHIRR